MRIAQGNVALSRSCNGGVFSTDLRPIVVTAKIYIYIRLNTVKIGH